MNTFQGINLNSPAVFDTLKRSFGIMSPPLQAHLRSVYACLAIGLLSAALAAYLYVFAGFMRDYALLSAIGMLVLSIMLVFSSGDYTQQKKRMIYFIAMSFLGGHLTGPLLSFAMVVNPQLILLALLGTGVVFICFTLCAMLSKRGSFFYLGSLASSLLSWTLLLQLACLFTGSCSFWKLETYLALGSVLLFILYDTQLIIYRFESLHDKDYIMHACQLFLDVLILFKHLLVLLVDKEAKAKKKNK